MHITDEARRSGNCSGSCKSSTSTRHHGLIVRTSVSRRKVLGDAKRTHPAPIPFVVVATIAVRSELNVGPVQRIDISREALTLRAAFGETGRAPDGEGLRNSPLGQFRHWSEVDLVHARVVVEAGKIETVALDVDAERENCTAGLGRDTVCVHGT
jgi:hypothetical protein